MKKYINILPVLAALVCCISCTDFVNNYAPENVITEDAFFKTDADMLKAIDPIYHFFLGDGGPFCRTIYWEITAADDVIFGRDRDKTYTDLVNFRPEGREAALGSNPRVVETIARTNWLIYNLLKIGPDKLSPIGKRVLGEAYFLRGYTHFFYAYRMGRADNGVPFDRYEDYDPYVYGSIPEQRATVMDNYALIIEDLTKAADLLPFFESYANADYGRAHKTAAWAAMVKTYAYWAAHDPSKWAMIPPLADKIETEGKRALLPNFYDVFTVEKGNWSAEEIWSINTGSKNDHGSYWACVMIENKGWGRVNGWGYFKPTLGLYDEFEPGDQRRAVTMLEYNQEFQFYGETRRFFSNADLESGFMMAKYLDPYRYGTVVDGIGISPYVSTSADGRTDLNLSLFRFAEVLLFKAEALIEQGKNAEAAQVLNRITTRAGLGNKYTSATMANLMHERRCELAGEFADRLGDLRRWCIVNDANHRGLALPMLRAPKMGRHYANRSDPTSTWTPIDITEGDKTRNFDPEVHIVWPYNPDDVNKAGGKLKQNKGYK